MQTLPGEVLSPMGCSPFPKNVRSGVSESDKLHMLGRA